MVEGEESMPYIDQHWIAGILAEEKLSSLEVPVHSIAKFGERWTSLAMYVLISSNLRSLLIVFSS